MIQLNFPNEVTSEEAFFNRDKEWKMIDRVFQTRESIPVIIQGERRIGKTSLQTIAAQRLNRALDLVPIFLPLGGNIRSRDEFAKEILLALRARLETKIHGREPDALADDGVFRFDGLGEYTQMLRNVALRANGDVFLVCVDEFDVTLQSCEKDDAKRLADLVMHLIDEGQRAHLPIRFFFSMTTVPGVIEQAFGSSFLNSATFVELSPFSQEDTATMVEKLLAPGVTVLDAAQEALFAISGGHPYIVKLILDRLLFLYGDELEGLVVDEDAITQATDEATNDPRARAVFANIYSVHFSDEQQQGLMLLLAERQAPHEGQASVSRQELRVIGPDYITAAELLARRGYLAKDLKGEQYRLRIPFLGLWLQSWERYESEVEKRLKDIRPRLRRMIDPWAGVEPTVAREEDLRKYGLLP